MTRNTQSNFNDDTTFQYTVFNHSETASTMSLSDISDFEHNICIASLEEELEDVFDGVFDDVFDVFAFEVSICIASLKVKLYRSISHM